MWHADVLLKALYRNADLCTMRVDKKNENLIRNINTGNIRGVAKFIHKFSMYGELFLSIYALKSEKFSRYETCNQGRCLNQDIIGGEQHNPFRMDSDIGAIEFMKGGGIWYSWKNVDDHNKINKIMQIKVIINEPISIEENDILNELSQQLQSQIDTLNLQCKFDTIDYQAITQMFNVTMLRQPTTDDDSDDDDDAWD
jgi:hypothetical protein